MIKINVSRETFLQYKLKAGVVIRHATSYPFKLDFDLFDEAKWLDKIITKEGIIC